MLISTVVYFEYNESGEWLIMMNATILIADDEAMILDVASAMFEHLNYKVIPASNGQEALQFFHQNEREIDLIILDISMPEMDGFQCLREIRKTSKTPVLLSSGISQTLTDNDIVQNQAQGILPKPFTLDILQQTVERTLHNFPR